MLSQTTITCVPGAKERAVKRKWRESTDRSDDDAAVIDCFTGRECRLWVEKQNLAVEYQYMRPTDPLRCWRPSTDYGIDKQVRDTDRYRCDIGRFHCLRMSSMR